MAMSPKPSNMYDALYGEAVKAERKRCAQTCRGLKLPDNGDAYSTRAAFNDGCDACAEAIERAEG